MSTQIPLGLTPLLSYSPENFLVHGGVRKCVDYIKALSSNVSKNFAPIFIQGSPRLGKTHLSIYLSELLTKNGAVVRLVDALELRSFVEKLQSKTLSEDSYIIIDDLQRLVESLAKIEGADACSSVFVSLVELVRAHRGGIIFLSALPLSAYDSNPHVRSRLHEAKQFLMVMPSEEEFPSLIQRMLIQRGISLSAKSVSFIAKRLPKKDVISIENYIANVDYLSAITGEEISLRSLRAVI